MSRPFTEFLREQAAKQDAEVEANRGVIEEWQEAVRRLLTQLRAWLADSDPDHFIQIKEEAQEVTEPGLGRYTVPRLDLRVLGKWVGIIPKARKTVAAAKPPQRSAPVRASGRVDITDELRRYVLYRVPGDGAGDQWFIDDLRSEPKPLDQQAFEAALMSYLR